MKKEKSIFLIICAMALVVVMSIAIVRFYYNQSKILRTDDELIAKLSLEMNITDTDNITIVDRVLQYDTALFWFVYGESYIAMNCEIVDENEYIFTKFEELRYYNEDIVFTIMVNESYLINDERCTDIHIIDNQTNEEIRIPVETIPYVFRFSEYNKPQSYSLSFLDADGNDLHYK